MRSFLKKWAITSAVTAAFIVVVITFIGVWMTMPVWLEAMVFFLMLTFAITVSGSQ